VRIFEQYGGGMDLEGERVTLRPAAEADVPALTAIRRTPEVFAWWRGGEDLEREVRDDLADEDAQTYVISYQGRVVGAIQWSQETEPDYRHASIDIYLDPSVHGRGLGTDAVRTLARHLVTDGGHHRITIDPAVENEAAIRSYTKVGFRPVGVMRRYERGADGTWHDNLLMDLLSDELQ
jgi:aminoglycoside 6'-N-acetyltransferase